MKSERLLDTFDVRAVAGNLSRGTPVRLTTHLFVPSEI
jgi:hypothetical protein